MSKIDDILETIAERAFVVCCNGEFDYDALVLDKDFMKAKAQLLQLVLEVIGEDEKYEMLAGMEPIAKYPDDDIKVVRNQLRADQRQKAIKLFGGEDEPR